MYEWRKMSPQERDYVLALRKYQGYPWHSPPHQVTDRTLYHITAACYEHKPILGSTPERMSDFEETFITQLSDMSEQVLAWSVLPNHYHVLIQTPSIQTVLSKIGKLHGRTSFTWNGEDNKRGRSCWYRCRDRAMRTKRHKAVTINYIHYNAVHHGYVSNWLDWPFSSALVFFENTPPEVLDFLWREYPLYDYGKGWDDPDM